MSFNLTFYSVAPVHVFDSFVTHLKPEDDTISSGGVFASVLLSLPRRLSESDDLLPCVALGLSGFLVCLSQGTAVRPLNDSARWRIEQGERDVALVINSL